MSTPRPLSPPTEERSWIRAVGLHAIVTLLLYGLTISVGFRAEYVLLSLVWTFITFAGPRSRRFANIALPFLCVGILYDQILPHLFQYRPEPHVADLYNFEKKWFGIHTANGVVIPAEWFRTHTSPWLDIPTGFGYMAYMFESFLVAIWMFFQDEERTAKLAWAFLIVNLIGFTSWIVFPAAPPWYVAQYGLGPAHMDAIPSAAGAARFDQFFGISYFSGFYQRSHNVYGAMPSLHVAYPLVVYLSTVGMKQRWLKLFCFAFFLLIAFAAVYLDHHYVIDAIAGIVVAFVAWGLALWARSAFARRRAVEDEAQAVVVES
jgi:inositol phosphorylceramide synthase catalytic subunit